MKLINYQKSIECPECGCKEIHVEYDNNNDMLSCVRRQADEGIPVEIGWCYCLCCGVMFDPMQEAFAV